MYAMSCILVCILHMFCTNENSQAIVQCTQLWFPIFTCMFSMLVFNNWVCCGIVLKCLSSMSGSPHVQPKSSAAFKRRKCQRTRPREQPHHKYCRWWEWWERRRGRGWVRPRWQPANRGTSSESSSGYKLKLFVLRDRKLMSFYEICMISCVACLPCDRFLNGTSSTYLCEGCWNMFFSYI